MEQTKNNCRIEVRRSNFTGKYSIRVYHEVNGVKEYHFSGKWSTSQPFPVIKNFLKSKNIDCPNAKDLKLFSDGFEYSYGEFDGYGRIVGKVA